MGCFLVCGNWTPAGTGDCGGDWVKLSEVSWEEAINDHKASHGAVV